MTCPHGFPADLPPRDDRRLRPRRRRVAPTLLVALAVVVLLSAGSGHGFAAGRPGPAPLTVAAPASAATAPGHAVDASRGRVARCRAGRVALTFDDGPSASITPRLVRQLRTLRVPATFFMVGSRVAAAPATARMVDRAGLTIGNHTATHADLTGLSDARIREELSSTARSLRRAGVGQDVDVVRPPYGAVDRRVRAVVRSQGYSVALWDVDPRDWDGPSSATITRSVLQQVRARGREGSTVLLHDGVGNSEETLASVPRLVRTLRREGYCLVEFDAIGS